MSSRKEPEVPKKTKPAVSRRGFIQGVGLGTGALGGALTGTAEAAPQSAGGAVSGPGAVPFSLRINGKTHNVTLEPRVTLLDALRDSLDLTGAKRVCDRGTCGACTVIVDGRAVYACSVLAIDMQGRQIQTIEGIGTPDKPHPVTSAFVEHDAQQCGYCTPGFVMAAKAYLDRNPNPRSEADVEAGLGGNLCRCGTYVGVRKAVLDAARDVRRGRNA
ncbi:MAG: (2Fe-2S)-binding protein [Bryobacterales bacterium]|nr:(2Fe-2S)-binding protein [Bryobacterales bacterium]